MSEQNFPVTYPAAPKTTVGLIGWAASLIQVLNRKQAREKPPFAFVAGDAVVNVGAVPDGWLLADGSTKLRADYPDLFAKYGTTFNTGGETGVQFRLPSGTPFTGATWIVKI